MSADGDESSAYGGELPDDGGADYDLAEALLERCEPLTEGSPPWRYLIETRGLPADARVLHAGGQIAELEAA